MNTTNSRTRKGAAPKKGKRATETQAARSTGAMAPATRTPAADAARAE